MSIKNRQKGITLVEVLVTIGILGILSGISVTALAQTRERAKISAVAENTAAIVREVQNLAISAHQGTSWGLYCDNDEIIKFGGTEETTKLSPGFTCLTANDIEFKKLTGWPETEEDLILFYRGEEVKKLEIRKPGKIDIVNINL